jgi:hypothetical protein
MFQEANEVRKTEEALRTSVFVLSSLAGFIQRQYALQNETDTDFPNVVHSKSRTSSGLVMNLLATLFTRGTQTELTEVVAVSAGPRCAEYVKLVVLSR